MHVYIVTQVLSVQPYSSTPASGAVAQKCSKQTIGKRVVGGSISYVGLVVHLKLHVAVMVTLKSICAS